MTLEHSMRGKKDGQSSAQTFFGRVRRDVGGNTLAMMAIAMVPLSALAGSAIDTSRLYFVKVRLQQACDAGALAGRKFMVGTDYSTDANTRAEAFFNNNFKAGTYGSTAVTKSFVKTVDNQVRGTASATVPMTIMKMFGSTASTLDVTCEAKLEIPNLDMMFVLDTTGSMNGTNTGDTVNRITALRTAVVNFYDTIEAAKTTAARTRYGFVPYSSTVNVGLLLKREWMVDDATYQSREPADMTTTPGEATAGKYITTSDTNWVDVSGTKTSHNLQGDPEACVVPPNTTKTTTPSDTGWVSDGNGGETRTWTQLINGSSYSGCTGGAYTETRYNQFKQTRTQTRKLNPDAGTVTPTETKTWWWNYKLVSFNVRGLKGSGGTTGLMSGGRLTLPLAGGGGSKWTDRNIDWNGASGNTCIEERGTVRQSDYSTIPTDAYDMDVDKIPEADKPETQWKPFLPGVVYARKYTNSDVYKNEATTSKATLWPTDAVTPVRYNGGYVNLSGLGDYAACVTYAKKLDTIARADLVTYMNALKTTGRTYHDIGFVWGMRLLSPTGLFASENATAPNGSQIARHIIFMTDGDTETNFFDYDAYGLAGLDRRRTDASRLPTDNGETNTIVEKRLTALCRAAQNRNTTVWVIAFGTDLTPLLSNCASPGVHAFQANNAAELNDAFSSIAANIAKLRVSK